MRATPRSFRFGPLAAGVLLLWIGLLVVRPQAPRTDAARKSDTARANTTTTSPLAAAVRKASDPEEVRIGAEPAGAPGVEPISVPAIATRIADRILSQLEDPTRFPELTECSRRFGLRAPECAAVLDPALGHCLSWTVGRELATGERFAIADLIRELGPDQASRGAHALVEQTLRTSNDPIARVSALALSERIASESSERQPVLRSEVFTRLGERTSSERGYLLNALEQAPDKHPNVLRELGAIVISDRYGVAERRQALRALGASGAAESFDGVLRAMQHSAPITTGGALQVVGPALARCSLACTATMARLAEESNSNSRLAVLEALGMVEDRALPGLARALLPQLRLQARRGSPLERDQLAFIEHRLQTPAATADR